MSQFSRNSVALVVVIVVLGLLGIGAGELAKRNPISADSNSTSQNKVAPIAYDGQDSKNVLELLKANHEVQSVDSSYGTYVQAIDGINSTESSVWLYYINDEPGLEAADKAVTKTGDKVEWRYESF